MTPPALTATMDGEPGVLAELSVELPDGLTAWFQRNRHDCLQAAVATALGLPYEAVDLPGRNLNALCQWANARELAVVLHTERPPNAPIWIGINFATRHTIVGSGDQLLHDPASGWEFPAGRPAPPEHLDAAFILVPREEMAA